MKKVALFVGESIGGNRVAERLLNMRVPFAVVTADEIDGGGLGGYSSVIFPGGGSIGVSKRGARNTVEFVESGGGFMGICAGCQFGARLGLIAVKRRNLRATGIFDMRVVARHPITKGYTVTPKLRSGQPWKYSKKGRVRIRYCNGGMYEAREDARVLVSFDEDDRYGAVIVGTRGGGKVVLISPHPEGTPPPEEWGALRDWDASTSQDPLVLFENAVRYVAS